MAKFLMTFPHGLWIILPKVSHQTITATNLTNHVNDMVEQLRAAEKNTPKVHTSKIRMLCEQEQIQALGYISLCCLLSVHISNCN